MENEGLRVECYAGYRGEETPQRFYLGNRPVEITAIVDRWIAPDHRYFKVRSDDGALYILRHESSTGLWDLTLYDSNKRAETRLSS